MCPGREDQWDHDFLSGEQIPTIYPSYGKQLVEVEYSWFGPSKWKLMRVSRHVECKVFIGIDENMHVYEFESV